MGLDAHQFPPALPVDASRQYEDRLRALTAELAMAEERQRRQIAGVLHDEIAQTLAHVQLKLRSLPPADPINEAIALLDDAIDRTRSIMADLSPPVLRDLGLSSAIAWLAERFGAQYPVEVSIEDDGADKPLAGEVSVTLFQAVRELLTNVAKHALATKVTIDIRRAGDGAISIVVADDGVGMRSAAFDEVPGARGGFGLFHIRERLKYLGGEARLLSRGIERAPAQQGTRIELVAPLRDGADGTIGEGT